jgi:NCAIR mutase (PurE)-related protein
VRYFLYISLMMKRNPGFRDLGFAKIDTDRRRRRGFPEAVFCPGKEITHIKRIAGEILRRKQDLILTKLERDVYDQLSSALPELKYSPVARLGYVLREKKKKSGRGLILVVSAGTADIPVAEEAALTSEIMGGRVERLYDVGVAGVHRLFGNMAALRRASVIIVVAGMEGALSSLVSGLVACPLIAVPTSCGYGASFGGLSALLTMLNGCSPGVTVVNIDNGFGAGYFAALVMGTFPKGTPFE